MKCVGPFLRLAIALLALCVFTTHSALAQSKSAAHKSPASAPKYSGSSGSANSAASKQLEQFCRALKLKNPTAAYTRLSAFATQKSSGALGMRAALALGYYDYGKGHFPLASKWFSMAQNDPLLRDYALYWSAATDLAMNHNAEAVALLKRFRKDYPDSVIMDQALQSLGSAALALNQPGEVLAALDTYGPAKDKPALLFLRAEAREQSAQTLQAAAEYQLIYLRFPTSEQAREAGQKLAFLRGTLGGKLPAVPVERQLEHAAAIFGARQWEEARDDYSQLLPSLTGADRERAKLRILVCGQALGGTISEVAALQITDPDVDAERYYTLANYYRSGPTETQMAAAVESAATRAPASRWTESALFLAGNYFWVQLDRDRAAGYYKRLYDGFPTATDALPAQWRFAWTSVLERQATAAENLGDHVRRFPGSQFTPDALYWLGRLAEESQNLGLARSYYEKLQTRFPQNYFANAASARLHTIGVGGEADPEVFTAIPPVPAAMKLGATIPKSASIRQARADALRSIAFDASAELELRAAFASTGEPRLLLEAAQEAVTAGHVGAAIVTIRQIYPQLEWRPFDQVPREVWLTAYAMPFQTSIVSRSTEAGVDPMLTAGLIRQESAYDPEARSGANAFGLMQLLPKTARRFAKQAKVRYSTPMLYEPDYNIRIGTIYFAGLKRDFGSVESALAAYNAGEERVTFWTSGQTYREPAEFVDSIPFTETREYVEIVTRNADIYRKLYGSAAARSARGTNDEPRKTGTGAGQ
jgi:soluble lytic murein transglycosylase